MSLFLKENCFDYTGAKEIADALMDNKTLKELSLATFKVKDEIFFETIKQIKSNVKLNHSLFSWP